MATPKNSNFKNQDSIDIVAANVYHYRKLKGLTQDLLGFHAGTNVKQIQRIEKAQSDSKIGLLKSIADVLDVTLADLVTKIEE